MLYLLPRIFLTFMYLYLSAVDNEYINHDKWIIYTSIYVVIKHENIFKSRMVCTALVDDKNLHIS